MNIETALIDLAPATKRAITRFDKAAQEYAVIGSQYSSRNTGSTETKGRFTHRLLLCL